MTDNNRIPDIVCDVELPRTDTDTGIPMQWIQDRAVSLTAKGLIFHAATYPVGTVVSGAELSRGWEVGQSVSKLVAELVDAGYLLPEDADGTVRYRLVHPEERLGTLPRM